MRDFFSNRYVRMLGAYVGIGVAAVIAYSPGLMALSPMDPSILRAGASLIAGVLMCAGLGVSTHMAMRDERRYVPLGTGAQGVDPQVVTRALEANEADEVLGALARRGVGALRDGAKKVETLRTLVFARFSQGSMTSERFIRRPTFGRHGRSQLRGVSKSYDRLRLEGLPAAPSSHARRRVQTR